ncbi:hypothetical protein ABD70_04525 [Alkalihalobacillus lehensis]|nr:hypothetical protein [Shouchella lehensis]
MYDELLEQEIIPAIEREDPEALSNEELIHVAEKLDELVQAYDQQIEASERHYVPSVKRQYNTGNAG